ncbi:outer membrane protein [Phenylobacterium deserti]|uniref:Outer membrane protein beta-barrel domain-containing protein n=1 Tax=Phenylobacterium deserti TaxID=1914756 RepID=A0A328ASD4_9CAUL|nr:outer membrane beta-barrel protein [Phenylobacterium deserti]RAK56434.1 hypothetical protein DJ018_00135 [Phenylobacterium deserti]
MKKITLAAFAAVAALSAGAASAQDAGWYVQGNAGANFQNKLGSSPSLKGDDGWAVSGAVGRQITPNIRAEGELFYSTADGKIAGSGDLETFGGFVNGYYDFNPGGAIQPFLGAGVGYAKVKVDGRLLDDDDSAFAYQFKAGVAHPFSERLTGEVAYRYVNVADVELGRGAAHIDGDFETQAVTVGLRYGF